MASHILTHAAVAPVSVTLVNSTVNSQRLDVGVIVQMFLKIVPYQMEKQYPMESLWNTDATGLIDKWFSQCKHIISNIK